MLSLPCRDGWLRHGGWLRAVQTEEQRRHENVSSPDSHARGSPGLRRGSDNVWYVPNGRLSLAMASWTMENLSHLFSLVDNTACVKYPQGGSLQPIIFQDVYGRYWCSLSLSRIT